MRPGAVWNDSAASAPRSPKEATMAGSSVQSPSTTPRAPTEATGWTGWIGFAAFIMMLSGVLTGISGFIAVINHNWTAFNNDGAPYGSVWWWGWWSMFVGLFVVGIGI